MTIKVTKVRDTLRFLHFMRIKHGYKKDILEPYVHVLGKEIKSIRFYNLRECEVRYLQVMKVCNLKIIQ